MPASLVERSLEVIRSGQAPSGAILAAPMFPQHAYSWFRDGAFIAEALDLHGELEAAARFHAWAAGVIDGAAEGMIRATEAVTTGHEPDPAEHLHCRDAVDGSLATGGGFHDEGWPTFQLDGPGIWLWSLLHHVRMGGALGAGMARVIPVTARYLAALWQTPCFDAWEESPDRVHTSTVAAVAVGLDAARALDHDLETDDLVSGARAAIDEWLNDRSGPYTKWDGSAEVDASLLWLVAPYRLVAPDDARFAATLEAIEADLIRDGHGVHRYRSDTYYGGGAWPILTAAHGRVLLRRAGPGDRERAEDALRWIEATADGDGLLPEQVDHHALAPDCVVEWVHEWGPPPGRCCGHTPPTSACRQSS